ncbi:Origin recognition complex subunit 1, partial [Stegodyphus mimosarum]
MSRIQELQAFDPDAVQLVARKVAAISGDARRALDICRFATEVVTSTKSSPKKKCKVLIGMEHVDIALQQMFSSPLVLAIRSSSNIAKLFFRGMLSEFMRTGSEETTLLRIHQ